jgi:hypothetical protein
MSNAFDIEKAKAGEPIEYNSAGGRWVAAHFVGATLNVKPVIQRDPGHHIFACEESELRMAPKKVKVRYRVEAYKDIETGEIKPFISSPHEDGVRWSGSKTFVEWLTEWLEAEVEQ